MVKHYGIYQGPKSFTKLLYLLPDYLFCQKNNFCQEIY